MAQMEAKYQDTIKVLRQEPIVIIVRKTSGYLSGEISIDEVRENYEVIKILKRNKI